MDATVNHATNALCLANALRNQLYIKLLYLPMTTSQIKHMSASHQTHSKQDLRTIKRHFPM